MPMRSAACEGKPVCGGRRSGLLGLTTGDRGAYRKQTQLPPGGSAARERALSPVVAGK